MLDEYPAQHRKDHQRGKIGLWLQIERLVATSQLEAYAEAKQLLLDLHDLARRKNDLPNFFDRLQVLVKRHRRKEEFIDQLRMTGLLDE